MLLLLRHTGEIAVTDEEGLCSGFTVTLGVFVKTTSLQPAAEAVILRIYTVGVVRAVNALVAILMFPLTVAVAVPKTALF